MPPALRRSLQQAYAADFGVELSDADAEALGAALVRVFAPVFLPTTNVHRSSAADVDESSNKRDSDSTNSTTL